MTVYHGGYMPVKQPEIRIGRNTKDFFSAFACYSKDYTSAAGALD